MGVEAAAEAGKFMDLKITKFGHSCVLIEDGQTKILFDPGMFSEIPDLEVDAIIITHKHQDHIDLEKHRRLFKENTRVITNSEVSSELLKSEINSEILEDGGTIAIGGVKISAHGNEHAVIHPDIQAIQNTGYMINDSIFHPGDSLYKPLVAVSMLLLPVIAPWSKINETLDYIDKVGAKVNFPIHDGFLIEGGGPFYRLAKQWCEQRGLEFIEPELNKAYGHN